MQVIKKVLIILYTLILGFMVFCNTSVFGEDIDAKYKFVQYVSNGYDDYWVNMQDSFDDMITRYSNKNGNQQMINNINSLRNGAPTFDYVVIPVLNVPNYLGVGSNNNEDKRGYVVVIYNTASTTVTSSTDFTYGTINDFYGGYYDNVDYFDNSFSFNAVKVNTFRFLGVWNNGNNYGQKTENVTAEYVPVSVLNYYHHIYYNYIDRNNTSGATQITGAINNQTNTIKNESAKVTSAIQNQTQATKEQTNALLDTNNTGNETMSVNDTTQDTSADLTGIYNSISSAFTTEISADTTEDFTLTLPNGDNHTFSLKANVLTSILNNYPVLKVFYQAFFYVVFCGYVIFDFKRIINKLKEGDIDNVVGSSNPVDSVVNMSLK